MKHSNEPTPATIYVSGGITGRPPTEYRAHFQQAATKLEDKGWIVTNPLYNGLPEEASWHAHMRADIRLLTYCQAIYMLRGWEKSTGATAEHALAKALGMSIYYEEPPRHPDIKHAIETALGVSFRDICRRGRKRSIVYARFIYCHLAAGQGDCTATISQEISHKHSDVSYYLRRYDSELKFNREFRNAARTVADLLRLHKEATQ